MTDPALRGAVLGRTGLAVDVVSGLLQGLGVTLTSAEPAVVVLVQPEAADWDAARSTGAPIVLALPDDAGDGAVVEAVLAGADAVVHADTAPAEVLEVLETVRSGGTVLAPAHVRMVAGVARSAAGQSEVVLSRREAQIVASIAEGKAVKQTARDLGISAKTVENLQGRLFRKLGVRNRAQAVARAHGLGLLEPAKPPSAGGGERP